jgi:hypothetical protein
MRLSDCRLIELPTVNDLRSKPAFIESGRQIPFEIKRVFYLYDVPGGAKRAGHALKQCQQLIVANSGSFDVVVDDGFEKKEFALNRTNCGLYIPPLIWREIVNFSYGSVCSVLASEFYSETDYFRQYKDFLSAVRGVA